MVESEREIIGGEKTIERRLFISSLAAKAVQALRAVRGDWGIENQLHWCLEISFREAASRVRSGEAAENLAVIRDLGLKFAQAGKDLQNGSQRQTVEGCAE